MKSNKSYVSTASQPFLKPLTDAHIYMAEAMKREDTEAKKCEERKTDRQVVIKDAEEVLSHVLPDEKDTSGIMLKAQEAILLENQHKPYGISTNANSPWISRCPRCGKKIEGKQTRFCAKGIEINAEHICEIIELFKQLRVGKWE